MPKKQKLYTYAADVIKTVDADTFDLEIDVGFKSKQEHRVRLRGIDAPETGSAKGRKAKRFPGETDAEVIAESGKLLNQVLIDKGLARKVE